VSLRLPLWIYWTLAGLGVAGALAFTIVFDFGTVGEDYAHRLLFTVWGGPAALVISAGIVTLLKRSS
jgi:hypothetical protein